MRQAIGVVGIGLVDLHVERLLGVARVEADHRQAVCDELGVQPGGQGSGLDADAHGLGRTLVDGRRNGARLAAALAAPDPSTLLVEHVDCGLFHRNIETDILLHGRFLRMPWRYRRPPLHSDHCLTGAVRSSGHGRQAASGCPALSEHATTLSPDEEWFG